MAAFGLSVMRCLIVAVATCALVLGGCGKSYQEILNSWVNHDVNELIRSWGAPNSTFRMPNGNIVLIFESGSSYTEPVTVQPGQTTARVYGNTVYSQTTPATIRGGDTIHFSCRTEIETNQEGRIVYWRYQGNAC